VSDAARLTDGQSVRVVGRGGIAWRVVRREAVPGCTGGVAELNGLQVMHVTRTAGSWRNPNGGFRGRGGRYSDERRGVVLNHLIDTLGP
jgi:hypothetical protein